MAPYDSELTLVRGIVAGEGGAETEFVSRFRRQVEVAVGASAVPHGDAADVVQEVFVAALRQLKSGTFRHDSTLGTWLKRVVAGKLADYFRSRAVSQRRTSMALHDVAETEDRLVQLADQEALVAADEALRSLPARLMLVLRLIEHDGRTFSEVARLLGLSEKRIRALHLEARRRFSHAVLGHEQERPSRRLKE